MKIFIALLLAIPLLTPVTAVSAQEGNSAEPQKAVLITGASSGLGRAMAELMASRGVFVYAGARKDSDMAELNAIENIQALRLDVTVQSDIDAAVATIREAGRGLYGLVNNAGVAVLYPLIEMPQGEFDFQMDVNVDGPFRVTKAFAPLIIESQGRITTTGSISGILSSRMFGAYSMSKHAMEAFTDSLAAEMDRFGVRVSIIEPGNFDSDIGANILARMQQKGIDTDGSPYAEDYARMQGWLEAQGSAGGDPMVVAEATWQALFEENPKRRYLVVPNEKEAERTIGKAVEELVQLNQRQPYSFSREELLRMLDAALAANP